jgi:hypothetical protein
MPQVPYTGVPDVQPEERTISNAPQLNIRVDPNAFGANVGHAVEQLGGTLDKVGDELWQRAVAFQQIKNQSELDNLNTQFLQETAPIHARFSALQGKNPNDELPNYLSDLQATRERIGAGASNPQVARLFDSTTRNQIARDYFNGAGHAGEQLKIYQNQSVTGHIDALAHSAGLSPFDDAGFDKRVADTNQLARERAALQGLDPDEAVSKETSRLWSERLTAMAVKDPFTAKTLLQSAWDKGQIRSDDYAKLDKGIQYQQNTTGARNISSDIMNGRNWSLGDRQIPIEQAKNIIGGVESGNTYNLTTDSHTKMGRALGRFQVMETNLPSYLKNAGLPPMSPEDFLKDHVAQDKVFEANFGMDKYGSFNEAAAQWRSGHGVLQGPKTAPGALPAATGEAPAAFIFHHTGGRGTVEGVQETLRDRGLGVEYIMDRNGNITQTGQPGAAHMKTGWGTGAGLSNHNTVGMEVIANDNGDVTPAQVAAATAFIKDKYPSTPVFGHGEVNPGHKEADEGMKIVNNIRTLRGGQPDQIAAAPKVQSYLTRTSSALARSSPLSAVVDAGVQRAQQLSTDPLLPDYTREHVARDYNQDKAVDRDAIRQDNDTINDAIMGNFTQGKIPDNVENLRAIPQVEQAINNGKLTSKELLDLPGRLNRYRSAVAQKTDQEVANRLNGLADESPTEFMAIKDFTQFPLSQKSIGDMQKKQRTLRDNAEGNPDLAKALQYIRPQLPSDFDDASKKDYRLQFKGALLSGIESFIQDNGRKPRGPEEYGEIGRQLLKSEASGSVINRFSLGLFGSDKTDPWFLRAGQVPEGAKKAIRQDWADQDLGVPSDEQMRDAYVRTLFAKDYGKKKE